MRTADTGTTRIEQDGNALSVSGKTTAVMDERNEEMIRSYRYVVALVMALALAMTLVPVIGSSPADQASAHHPLLIPSGPHAGGRVHWASTSYPIPLRFRDSHSSAIRSFSIVYNTLGHWSQSSRFSFHYIESINSPQTRQNCPFTMGQVRGCDYNWGPNGMYGWTRYRQCTEAGTTCTDPRHTAATTFTLNNHYMWLLKRRYHTHCHEFGHSLGLWHSSNYNSSCMNYNPDVRTPDAHDYTQIAIQHNHTHTANTWMAMLRTAGGLLAALANFGTPAHADDSHDSFGVIYELNGEREGEFIITDVIEPELVDPQSFIDQIAPGTEGDADDLIVCSDDPRADGIGGGVMSCEEWMATDPDNTNN